MTPSAPLDPCLTCGALLDWWRQQLDRESDEVVGSHHLWLRVWMWDTARRTDRPSTHIPKRCMCCDVLSLVDHGAKFEVKFR